jgi:hypothetical protein
MQNIQLTRAGFQAQCTEYFHKNLDIGTYDEVLKTHFPKEEEAKQMNMQLSIAISKAIKTQGAKLQEALNQPSVKIKMFDTILRILRYGAIINSEHIYFTYFGGAEPSASFNIQYQAEKKILEKNGFVNIKEEFVLESELDGLEYISINGVETITQKKYDFKTRANTNAITLLNDIMFGYATYTRNGERLTIRVEKDTLKKSFEMANKKGASQNFKWQSQQAIKIAIAHALFRFLVNQDWDMEFYENEEKPTSKLQTINATEIQETKITENEVKELQTLIDKTNQSAMDICEIYNVGSLQDLTKSDFEMLKKNLQTDTQKTQTALII